MCVWTLVGAGAVREDRQRRVPPFLLAVEHHDAAALPALHGREDLHGRAADGAGRQRDAGLLQRTHRQRARDRRTHLRPLRTGAQHHAPAGPLHERAAKGGLRRRGTWRRSAR